MDTGPSRSPSGSPQQPSAGGSSSSTPTASASSSSVNAFSTALRPAPTSSAAANKGKGPAQPVAAGARGGAGPAGGRVVQNAGGAAGGQPGGAAAGSVSVGGPGGVVRRTVLNSILVSTRQKGNPVIQHIRTVPWEYGDINCDYQVGATAGLLYLSIRYHLLHPEYIHGRIADLGQSYSLRIVLVHCDADNHAAAIKELTKICLINGYTMMTCWTAQEAGRYLELYKSLERKPPDLIRERVDDSYMAHLTSALTSVKGVNKTDVTTLISNFGSFEKILLAPASSLSALPGVGDKKVKRLRDAFTSPFQLNNTPAKKKRLEKERQGRTSEAARRGEARGGGGGERGNELN
ncbi:hypothetical protein JCM8547_007640 [Rhodosporidiobolus lusitaniae]